LSDADEIDESNERAARRRASQRLGGLQRRIRRALGAAAATADDPHRITWRGELDPALFVGLSVSCGTLRASFGCSEWVALATTSDCDLSLQSLARLAGTRGRPV